MENIFLQGVAATLMPSRQYNIVVRYISYAAIHVLATKLWNAKVDQNLLHPSMEGKTFIGRRGEYIAPNFSWTGL